MELRRRLAGLVNLKMKVKEPPKAVSKELASLEALAAYHRYLRGLLAILSVLIFLISLVDLVSDEANTLSDVLVFIISLGGEVLIVKVYKIKAVHAGLTDPLFKDQASVLHSPYLPTMLLEMGIWMLHSPPGLSYVFRDAYLLDFLIILRCYCVLLYLNNATFVHRTFCRAMSALSEIPLSVSFYVRTSFMFDRTRTSVAVLIAGWCALALLFSKGEGYSFFDSLYFCFVTGATIGYGDIAPQTFAGRLVALFSWIFGLTVVGWVVGLTHEALSLSDAERHLYTLFRANDLCNRIPAEAAKVIQRSYRLYRARKREYSLMRLNYLAYWLSRQLLQFREDRRALRNNEASFMATMASFEKGKASSLAGGDSNLSSPSVGARAPLDMDFGRRSPSSSFSPISPVTSPNNVSLRPAADVGGEEDSAPPPPMASTVCPDDQTVPDVLRAKREQANNVQLHSNVAETATHGEATGTTGTSNNTNNNSDERIATLEATVDQLILLAEALVRKRASKEAPRRKEEEGEGHDDNESDVST